FLTPCKAAGLEWQTVRAMLASPSVGRRVSEHDLEVARTDYAKLSQASAQRVLRFWQVRHDAGKEAVAPTGAREPTLHDAARPLIASAGLAS
ncbi:MAG TPA: hypothetical protein VEF90_01020, partial [Xanthobacteraceae bacterium]|nr:hypothetical protein [Xanthobacteraceae bacterium]